MDTTVLEELYGKKEGVGCTYQKVLGYTPMLTYIGREGYILDGELRPGVQHSQKGTPGAIRRAREMSEGFVAPGTRLLWRLDGGCDSADTVAAIEERESDGYIIVHNRHRESQDLWLRIAYGRGVKSEPRPGKTVWIGETQRLCGDRGRRRCVFRVTKRTCDPTGQQFLEPKIEIRLFWTNLPESPEDIISLYADDYPRPPPSRCTRRPRSRPTSRPRSGVKGRCGHEQQEDEEGPSRAVPMTCLAADSSRIHGHRARSCSRIARTCSSSLGR
ncbi:MAG: transposase [Planctomycetes bacterium]|nr:transposase [Planctomycetota bacterium]